MRWQKREKAKSWLNKDTENYLFSPFSFQDLSREKEETSPEGEKKKKLKKKEENKKDNLKEKAKKKKEQTAEK